VTVQDSYGNTVTGYTGTVSFTSTDTNASVVLPAAYTFTTGEGKDNGVHTFTGTTLITTPTQTITVTDGSITVASPDITVLAAALDHFAFAPISSPQPALSPFSITITAQDAYNNTVILFTGTVGLTISGGSSIDPLTSGSFSSGVWSGSVTVTGSGTNRQITASASGKTGTSQPFDVGRISQATLNVVVTPSTLTYGSTATLSTTGGSGTGAVTYSATGSCTVSGNQLTADSGTGTCSVTATKAADANYNETTSAPATVTLALAQRV
jgi:adhesin/invasin